MHTNNIFLSAFIVTNVKYVYIANFVYMQCESHRNKISYLTKRNAYVSGTRKRLVKLTQI